MAAYGGHAAVVEMLIEHRANVLAETNTRLISQETNTGLTPQDLATSQSHLQVVAMLKAEAVTRAKCVAFAMGHHERLGVGSPVDGLKPEVLRMVLEQV
jgi:hypothetical protein